MLVAGEQFSKGKKLPLRWCRPGIIVKALTDYVYQVQDLRKGSADEIYGSRNRFYSVYTLDKKVLVSHVLYYETGMFVAHIKHIVDTNDGMKV